MRAASGFAASLLLELLRAFLPAMKIIVTGATGFLGHETALAAIRRGHHVVAVGNTRTPLLQGATKNLCANLLKNEKLETLILDEFPDAIANCAALPTIDGCEADPKLASALNVELPCRLAMLANHLSAFLVHVSTDLVFDGRHAPYAHTAQPVPLNCYGETKLAGEEEVLRQGRNFAAVLRVPLLSGNSLGGRHSLHERLLAHWALGERTMLSPSEIRQPVSVSNLAEVLVELCERGNLSGVYHWAGLEALSRLEIGQRIASHFGLDPARHIVAAEAKDSETRATDLRLELHPLQGKLKTRAQNFAEMLTEMRIPEKIATWHEAQTGVPSVRRLVKGVDF